MTIRASYDMTIKVLDESTQKEETYFLVRVEEENWGEKKISPYSPLGKAVFAKEPGQTVEAFFTKDAPKRFRIVSIEPT